jgi:hypothetical protein
MLPPWQAALGLTALLFVGAGCRSSAVSTSPSPQKCNVSVSVPQGAISAAGGQGTVTVATTAECAWTASSTAEWITGLTPASSQGGGAVRFQVSPNPGTQSRTGQITLNEVSATVTQAGASSCTVALAPSSHQASAAGGAATVAVTADSSCAWTTTSDVSWLTVTSGGSGTGNGTVSYSVASNSGPVRTGSLTIGGRSFIVTQQGSGPAPCTATLQPAALSVTTAAGTSTVAIAIGAGCAWSVVSHAGWLTVVGQGAGTGNGSVTISVAANSGGPRIGTLTIAGLTYQVSQAGNCSVSISPANQSVAAAGGPAAAVSVTANSGCTWTATTTAAWIAITSGANGSGGGAVGFTVAANTGPARIGTLTIGGQTHTVNQANGCTFSITPTSLQFSSDAAMSSPIAVTAGAGCAWTATSNDSWITVESGAAGTGPGTVTFSVTKNGANNPRTGTLRIAGLTFTVTQDRK